MWFSSQHEVCICRTALFTATRLINNTIREKVSHHEQLATLLPQNGWYCIQDLIQKSLNVLDLYITYICAPTGKIIQSEAERYRQYSHIINIHKFLCWGAAECEAAGMKISTSESEAMVFCQKTGLGLLKESKYLTGTVPDYHGEERFEMQGEVLTLPACLCLLTLNLVMSCG